MFDTYGEVEEDYVPRETFDLKLNNVPFKNIDINQFTKDDRVMIIDGDWLAYSVCCTLQPYDELHVAKGRINKKIRGFLNENNCNKVVVFCGSTGNFRRDLKLPKRINTTADNSGRYKDNRREQESPPLLEEVKVWLMNKHISWWAVGIEADDCIVITSVELTKKGVQNYIYGVDKDYNQIHGGGLYIIGHHEKPTWFDDTFENRFGDLWIKERTVTKSNGDTYKVKDVKGHGDKFLVYQCLTEDSADNYSCKNFVKNNFGGGAFGDVAAVKYINSAKSRKHLWELYLQRLESKLPPTFEYEAWNGEIIQSTPFEIADLYFRCACMIRQEGVFPTLSDYLLEVEADDG